MHIVFLSHEYPVWSPGGVGSFLQTFGRALVQNGHRVTVVGAGKDAQEIRWEDEGVQLIRLPKKTGWKPAFWHNASVLNRKLRKLQQQHPIDIIESAELGLAFLSRKHRAKKVIRLHGGHHFFAEAEKRGIDTKKGWLEKRSFAKADGFIAVSNYVKAHTAKYLSYHNKPVAVVPHPMDTDLAVPEVNVNNNRVLFAGTICEKKGVRQLLQAFYLLRKTHPEKHLDLFGRDWYYPNGDSYIERIQKELPTSHFEHVQFHGSIPKETLMKRYAEAAFCVFPSHMETQGLVTLEAMLMKKPVIFTQYGPGPETITNGVSGWLCDVYDPKAIAETMKWCIEHPKEAKEMGVNARDHIQANFDKSRILEQNIDFYQSLYA
ncbi:glycosyltransferase family 4 protein [Altibacter sp. HG106]|uniref:glycosyltransferase family 4 protein n=1 Tax=Altibacter sp. HG106 TaxID=3023937 RepID=UPI00234FE1FC|nr:glycosyltransferase family 4 protein [Altibacter sp. HG106]MDC7995694.1 glycosyltransferase family 4 protein [Altibacter sp. HG106]